MEVHLTPDQEALIRQGIDEGRYKSADEVVQEALARWEEIQRSRMELVAALEAAEADLDAGRYTDYDADSHPGLLEELKREARELRDRERARA